MDRMSGWSRTCASRSRSVMRLARADSRFFARHLKAVAISSLMLEEIELRRK
jgi:hypothetical protein